MISAMKIVSTKNTKLRIDKKNSQETMNSFSINSWMY